jgi:hypothetical protein
VKRKLEEIGLNLGLKLPDGYTPPALVES